MEFLDSFLSKRVAFGKLPLLRTPFVFTVRYLDLLDNVYSIRVCFGSLPLQRIMFVFTVRYIVDFKIELITFFLLSCCVDVVPSLHLIFCYMFVAVLLFNACKFKLLIFRTLYFPHGLFFTHALMSCVLLFSVF